MTALLFEPHNDDAALFASFLCLRHRPQVVTVLRSAKQTAYGVTAAAREAESVEAVAKVLGCDWEQWPYPDTDPDWAAIGVAMRLIKERLEPDRVFAPAWELTGHEHHNRVALVADEVFDAGQVTHYLTYTIDGKSTNGLPVPFDLDWVLLKLRALACYRSQIEAPAAGCTEHFLRDQHEYVVS